jgi:putative two-component system response regulator
MNSRIVLIDDDVNLLNCLERTLREADPDWQILTFACPLRAWTHLSESGADTVVCDLRMPLINGLQLLNMMHKLEYTRDIPFIFLTGQGDDQLRRMALRQGAADMLPKPANIDDLVARIRNTLRLKSFQDELKRRNAALEGKVFERTRELGQSRLEVIWRLAKAAEFRDEDTGNHVVRVASYSRAIGERLGLQQEFVENLFLTAPLHDIGKIGIPDSILLKPGKLNDTEWDVIKQHCEIGARILQDDSKAGAVFRSWRNVGDYDGPSKDDPLLSMAGRIALAHHEKWDGSGYPQGLAGEAIPLEGRIVAIADVYDALMSPRPYKPAFSHERSLSIVGEGVGRHFDPEIYRAFEACLEEVQVIRSSLTDEAEPIPSEVMLHEAYAVRR